METLNVVSLMVFCFILIVNPLRGDDTDPEVGILLALKNALSGDELQSWVTGAGHCAWFHVTCDIPNQVTRIDLGGAGLSNNPDVADVGLAIAGLAGLPKLKILTLNKNNLNGTVPQGVTDIPYVDLTENPQLKGPCTTSVCSK